MSRTGTTFASLADPDYRLLWIGGAIGFMAMPMQAVARGYLAYDLTGSNAALGAVFLGMGVSMLVCTPLGGLAADRFSKRRVLMAAYAALAASAGFVVSALLADRLAYWMLVVSAVLQGAAFSFLAPARLAFSAELVGRERLVNAIMLAQISMNGARVIGPSIAGAMMGVSVLGPEGVYLALTAALLVALWLTARLPAGAPKRTGPVRSPLEDLVEGLRYVGSHPEILNPLLMSLVVVATAFPYISFLPSLVEDLGYGAGLLGLMSSAGAVGAMAVSLVIAGRSDRRISDRAVAAAGLAFGAGVVVLGLVGDPVSAVLVTVGVGAANAAFQSLNNSLVLMRADDELHGRVQSLLMLGFSAFGIFALPLGALADAVGLRSTFVAMGTTACLAVVTLALAARPAVRTATG